MNKENNQTSSKMVLITHNSLVIMENAGGCFCEVGGDLILVQRH